jgi:hypothetical protein
MSAQQQIEIVRNNWIRASKEFNFQIIMPYFLTINGIEQEVFAFLPEYGSPNGMIIDLIIDYEMNDKIRDFAVFNSYFCSFVSVENFLTYDRDFFIDALDDWGKFQ